MITDLNLLQAVQRESHVRIDLQRYASNIQVLREIAGQNRDLMAVVKADAYGHGAVMCARVAVDHGATHIAVSRIWEAIKLRREGISAPILVFGGPNPEAIHLAIQHDLTLTVGTVDAARLVIAAVESAASAIKVHLKVDSGLHRYGIEPKVAPAVASELFQHPLINLEGVYSHYSSSDEVDETPSRDQMQVFEATVKALNANGIRARYIHMPNSAAIISGKTGISNMVRSGIASYGLAPSPDVPLPEGLEPVMTVRSSLTRVFNLDVGDGVSYGLTYRAGEPETAATVPVGYADGLPRSLSNKGWFTVDGIQARILGRVCMDQTVIRVPNGTSLSSRVQIIGEASSGAMTIDDVAAIDGTINYEIATRFSARMPRVYVEDGEATSLDLPALTS
jgi:alanine racemase